MTFDGRLIVLAMKSKKVGDSSVPNTSSYREQGQGGRSAYDLLGCVFFFVYYYVHCFFFQRHKKASQSVPCVVFLRCSRVFVSGVFFRTTCTKPILVLFFRETSTKGRLCVLFIFVPPFAFSIFFTFYESSLCLMLCPQAFVYEAI